MSSILPPESPGEPEFLGQSSPEPTEGGGRGRTKLVVLGGIGVVAAGAIGVGAWGVTQFLGGGGPGAASVLPDTVLAYAAFDLDPSASQKIEAIKTLKKFPAIDDELGLDADDDIRRWVVEKLRDDGECDLDFDADVEPWIGDKGGIAAVPNDEHVADPVFALQVTDEGKAADGIAKLFSECDGSEDFGIAFLDGYAIVAQTEEIANAAVSGAEAGSLADSAAYETALDELGDIGVATFYIAPDGPAALFEGAGAMFGETPPGDEQLDESLKDFEGAAGTVRFEDGGVEFAVAGIGVGADLEAGASSIADLPGSTIAALGFALPEDWLETFESSVRDSMGEDFYEQMLTDAELQTGLDLPEDLETLLGSGLVLALDGSTDFGQMVEHEDPSLLKAGLRFDESSGDARRVLDALLLAAGAPPEVGEVVKVRESDDRVALGFDEDYLDSLLAGGDLGDDETFRSAVAEADKAMGALFVDFDAADNWLDRLAADLTDDDPDVLDNVAPLRALGISGWIDGDTSHAVLRLSTD